MSACPDFETLSALVDGEADGRSARHADHCADCQATIARLQSLGDGLRGLVLAREVAPPALVERRPEPERRARPSWWRRAAVGSLALAAGAAALVVSLDQPSPISSALADEVVSQHLRAFANGRACEHESEDPADVGRYLRDRLGRVVDVPAPMRGRLVGARRCALFGEHAGAVVYNEGEVAVTMFLPAPGSKAARSTEGAVGRCVDARDGQTVCVLPGDDGTPRLVVGELPASALGTVVARN